MTATVDYLTLTTSKDELGTEWYKGFNDIRKYHPESRGREVKDRNLLGYSGFAIDGMLWWGHSHRQGYILQATSKFADDFFGKFYSPFSKVTRIDIAVTMPLKPIDKRLAERHYKKQVEAGAKSGKARLMTSSAGGATLYLGSTKSQTFGRLYDKSAQTKVGDQGSLWRYEVVIRKPRASVLAELIHETLKEQSFTSRSRDLMASYVYQWFFSRGVKPFWTLDEVEEVPLHVDYQETSADRKLRWIREQVAPSVAWLYDNGFSAELEDAIGFQMELPFTDLTAFGQ